MPNRTVLCLGDLHLPFTKRRTLDSVLAIAKKLQPQIIVQLGDFYDLYSFSRFARSHNLMTPRQELETGRRMGEKLWRDLQDVCPWADCFQLKGNHDERMAKRLLDGIPELEYLLDKAEGLWAFDGVKTQPSERKELILDGICFMHGYRRHGQHVTYNLMNTVVGHTHLGGVVYHRQLSKTLWELNCGYLADASSVPLSYSQQAKVSRMTLGVGWIDNFGPRFIPLG